MRDEQPDDPLAPYDLSAWEAPPSAPTLADAVLSRLREPTPAGAVEPEQRTSRRWWIVGGAAALAAVGGVALWGLGRAPDTGRGDVVASRAQHLELGSSAAELDPGTEIHWQRDRHRVTVAQKRGTAIWTVGGDDTLVIDAGAAVASVEATGASLRVEVRMNSTDVRTIGASTLTAAAVALVTVMVYEGHVQVAGSGQTVHVSPGASVEVRPAQPPRDSLAVGASPPDVVALQRRVAELETELRAPKVKPPAPVAACDAVALRDRGKADLGNGLAAAALAKFEASLACKADRDVERLAYLAACNSKNEAKAKLYFGKTGSDPTLAQVCVRNGIDPASAPAACDAVAPRVKGEQALQTGNDAAALGAFEASLRCAPAAKVERLAFLAACKAKNFPRARYYFLRLPPSSTTGLAQICIRNGYDPSAGTPSATSSKCDPLDSRTGCSTTSPAAPVTRSGGRDCQPKDHVDPFDTRPACATTGTLKVTVKPAGRIMIDGADTGKATPATLALAPGMHKVTLMIGDDRYTFPVTIKANETATLIKDLR